MRRGLSIRWIAAILGVWGCSFTTGTSTQAADVKTKLNYDQHVVPILRAHCTGCHQGDSGKGGLDVSTYSKLMEGGASGAVVKPGDAEGSRFFRLTAHKEQPIMPPKMPMIPKESVDTLFNWIQQGALENSGSKPVAIKPKADVTLNSIKRGKPEVVPMPTAKLRPDPVVSSSRANAVVAMSASPWAPLLAVGGQKQILLYHGDTMELMGVLPFNHGMPYVLKFSRNGSLLLAGGGRGGLSGKVVVYNVTNGEAIIEVGNENDAVLAADISADQTMVALAGPNKMIRIYSTKDGQLIREIKKHTDWIYGVEFSPDAVLLATSDRSGGLYVWEANTGREFYNLRGHTGPIVDLSWRDDSNVLASASEDATIRLWEMENGNPIKNWAAHGGGAQSVKFGHDNRLVSTGRDRITKIWDQNGANQKSFPAHTDIPLRVGFSHDGTKVYTGDWIGTVQMFASADAKLLAQATTNPQTPQQQLDAALKDLAVKQQAFDQVNAAFTAANAKAVQAAADAAPAQKLANDSAAQAKALTDAAAPLKAKMDQANAVLPALIAKTLAADVKSKAITEAYTKIKAAADANKANPDLQTAAAQSKAMADAAVAELAAATKAQADADAAAKQATAQYNTTVQGMNESMAAAKLAAEILAPRLQALQAAQAAVVPMKAALDKATAELAASKAAVEKLKAAVATPNPPKKG